MPMPSAPLIALFLSVACLQSANGLFVVLLGLRMVDADFPTTVTGLIMSAGSTPSPLSRRSSRSVPWPMRCGWHRCHGASCIF